MCISFRKPAIIRNLESRVERHLDFITDPKNLEFKKYNIKKIIIANKLLIAQIENIYNIIGPKIEEYIHDPPPSFEEINLPESEQRKNNNTITEDAFIEYMEASVEYFQMCID